MRQGEDRESAQDRGRRTPPDEGGQEAGKHPDLEGHTAKRAGKSGAAPSSIATPPSAVAERKTRGKTRRGKAMDAMRAARAEARKDTKSGLRAGKFDDHEVAPGASMQLEWPLSESPTHQKLGVPMHIVRGHKPGPVVLVTSAIHGDEISGVAIVRRVLETVDGHLERGVLVAVPVVNRFGFDRQDRYLPDRRDLNRHFPGEPDGHMAARIAHALFTRLVLQSDVGIDLHTAAEGATNLCHIRGDADVPDVKELMKAFGTPILVHGDGPRGSLRRAATEAGVPTILFEAGEPGRFQPHVVDVGHHGILRVLRHLGMVEGEIRKPPVQLLVRDSHWVRADHGGILDLQVEPGDLVQDGQRIGRLLDPMGRSLDDVRTHRGGVVLGVSTLPLVFPGKAIAHIGHLRKTMPTAKRFVDAGGDLGHVGPPQ